MNELKSGDWAIIVEVNTYRLLEMGLRPGQKIRMICPGNTCIISYGTTRLAIRDVDLVVRKIEKGDANTVHRG